jgi:signal transduction histidine kinase
MIKNEYHNQMNRRIIGMTALFVILCFYSNISKAQNQPLADSLINVLEKGGLNEEQRVTLLESISFYLTRPNDKVTYSKLLISESKKQGDYKNIITGYMRLGRALKLKGDLTEALEAYLEAAEISASNNDFVSQADAYTNIAALYRSNEDYKKSLDYFQDALELYTNKVDSQRLAVVYINYSYAAYKANMYDSAISLSNKAIYFAQFSQLEILSAYAQSNKALALARSGRSSESESQLSAAMQIMESNKDHYGLSDCLIEIGGVYLEQGNLKKAIENLENGYQIAMTHGLKEQIQNGAKSLSAAYLEFGDVNKAMDFQSKYYNYRDSLISTEKIRELADLRTEFEVGQKQIEVDLLEQEKRTQQIVGYAMVAVLVLIIALAIVLYRTGKQRQLTNTLLERQKLTVETQRDQLEELNHTKDRFFSIISHDIRGPVNAFAGVAELIRYYVKEKAYEDLVEITEYIDKSSAQLSALLDNLLKWAVSQQGEFPYAPEQVNISEMTTELQGVYQNMSSAKKIDLVFEVAPDVSAFVDRNSTMTILRNLIGNALKFTESEGSITLSAAVTADQTIVKVKDTGVGIPKEKLDTLFQLQDKKSTWGTDGEKGLGLGLQLVYEFSAMNKGSVNVESQEDVGTTFTVVLPRAVEGIPVAEPTA